MKPKKIITLIIFLKLQFKLLKNIDLENEFRKYLNKKQLDIINKL